MIRAGPVQVWVATAPVDLRKGFDTLAEHVRTFLGHDPLCGHLFVFRNRSGQRLKILWWDRNGLALYYKRLEQGTFQFPASDQKSIPVDSTQLMRLLEGLEPAVTATTPATIATPAQTRR
jgi:transposase